MIVSAITVAAGCSGRSHQRFAAQCGEEWGNGMAGKDGDALDPKVAALLKEFKAEAAATKKAADAAIKIIDKTDSALDALEKAAK